MKLNSLSGLTLVEALVIILLIGLLTAIFPVSFRGAKEKARRAKCMSNLKQLGFGIGQYYDDHTNMPPMVSVSDFASNIGPYISYSSALFVCPSDKAARPATSISNMTASSYAIVTNAVWLSEPMTPLLFDKFHTNGLTVLTGSNTWSRNSSHKDGGNVLWTDGHVGWNKSLDVGTNRYPVAND